MAPSTALPTLEVLDPSKPHVFVRPTKRINDGPDVAHFLTSKAYRDIGVFVLQLNRALCPRKPQTPTAASLAPPTARPSASSNPGVAAQTFPLDQSRQEPEAVRRLQELLEKVGAIIEEAPPDPGPRRFGNISFRTWYALLEGRAEGLLREYLPQKVLGADFSEPTAWEGDERGPRDGDGEERPAEALDELRAYFLGGFGSAQRLDYGTGHELSFLAFLGCLWKLGGFAGGDADGETERRIVLGVIEPYLRVVRRLILTYTLEPAGSHGVWGLDDHFFIPYIFGSAQLTRPISPGEAMPQEGSVQGAPKPSDVVKSDVVEQQRRTNMYFSAIGFIADVKKGPFWEHSPILFDISGIRDGWGKINKGMIKMFNAEVLSKFPVVQHFPFGSLFSWDQDPDAAAPLQTVHLANQPSSANSSISTGMPAPGPAAGTAAPWAQAVGRGAGPGIPYSRAPWAAAGSSAPSMTARQPPDVDADVPTSFPKGKPGTTSAQFTVTRAPWAKSG